MAGDLLSKAELRRTLRGNLRGFGDPQLSREPPVPNLLQNVMATLCLRPVLGPKACHESKGGLYE